MQKDKEFLKQCQLMDYSLLIIFFKDDDYFESDHDISSENRLSNLDNNNGVTAV